MSRKSIVSFIFSVLFMYGYNTYACSSECYSCDQNKCSKKCNCGETCKSVKKCDEVKICKMVEKNYSSVKSCSCDKVQICHSYNKNPKVTKTICVGKSAVDGHVRHGDHLGRCQYESKLKCYKKKCCKNVEKCECKKCHNKCDLCPVPDSTVSDAGVPDSEVPDMDIIVDEGGVKCNCPDGSTSEEDLEIVGGGCSVNSNSNSSYDFGIVFGMFLILLGIIYKRKFITIFTCIMLSCLVFSRSVYAYDDNYFVTNGGKVTGHLQPKIGIGLEYKYRSAQIVKKTSGDRVTDVMNHSTKLSIDLNFRFLNRLELGLNVPVELSHKTSGLHYFNNRENEKVDSGLGNVNLTPKFRILTLGNDTMFHLAVLTPIGLPTTTYYSVINKKSVLFSPTLVFELDSRWVDVSLNSGYTFSTDNSFSFHKQQVAIDDTFNTSFGVKVPISENNVELIGDSYVSVPTTKSIDKEDVPVEFLGGLRFYLPFGMYADVRSGAGVGKGVGATEFRLFAGLTWTPQFNKRIVVNTPPLPPPPLPCEVCPKCPEVEHGIIVLPPVFFDFDKDFVNNTSEPVLLKMAETLKNTREIRKIVITANGHTDSKGTVLYNFDLGKRRAQFVIDKLQSLGVKAKMFIKVSHSELEPYADNRTANGRAQNRRVEITIDY